MEDTYRKVIINTPEDYPKITGDYFCNRNGFLSVQKLIPNEKIFSTYMREIRWYLQPIELPSEIAINKKIFLLCSEMRQWDGKSSPKTTPELLMEFSKWMLSQIKGKE
jgi:hypothetical protein